MPFKDRSRKSNCARSVPAPRLDVGHGSCDIQDMSVMLTLRIPIREKEAWQKVARAVGEDLTEFVRKAVRQRGHALQAKCSSPWDDLLGSVSTRAPSATNPNVRRAMRSGRPCR